MATQVIQRVTDDLTGEEGASVAEFSLDGFSYEIDLTETSRKQLQDVLAPYVDAGRRVNARRSRVVTPAGKGAAKVDAAQRKAVRRWAQDNPEIVGFTVGDRGRIPDSVTALYHVHAGRSDAPIPVG